MGINRRRPAKRHGRVESPDSDPHPILDPRAPFRASRSATRCTTLGHTGHKPWRSQRARTSKTVHRRACAGLAGAGSLGGSGSVLNGVRCRLGTESLAWRLSTLHAGRQKPFWHTSILRIYSDCPDYKLCTINYSAGCCFGLDAGAISGPNV